MNSSNAPKDGDFAAYVESRQGGPGAASSGRTVEPAHSSAPAQPRRQSLEDILVRGEEPTEAFLDEWNAMRDAPAVSEEELERQALDAPREDVEPTMPE